MNIVLIGMRGVGKSAVGRILASNLKRGLVELDELVVQRAGASIQEIVARDGWNRFRAMEAGAVGEVAGRDDDVIVTGGGVVTVGGNVSRLKENGFVIWLRAGAGELLRRIGADTARPALVSGRSPREDMETALRERTLLYQAAADMVLDTEGMTPEAVAGEITSALFARGIWPLAGGDGQVCCLLGDPVAHSLSPRLHNAAYEALGLDFTYLALRVGDIKQAMDTIRQRGIRGASVTIPHKVSATRYLDAIDEAAREIGAVNTIVNDGGTLTGYNTDSDAAVKALEEAVSLAGKRAVIIGAGGAAAAIAVGLRRKAVALVILDRTPEKAGRLARMVGAGADGLDGLAALSAADILVNATPVGMGPDRDGSVVPGEYLHDRLTVFDVVYNPRETRLLREARERGGTVVYGYRMFLHQAAAQFALFTERQAPLQVMETALLSALGGDVC